jgi:hypothetical protein
MEIAVFDGRELEIALGAVRAIPRAPSAAQDDFLRALARLHGRVLDPGALPTPTAREVAAEIADPHRRKRLVECATVMTMVDGEVEPGAAAAVTDLARALGVDGATSRTLRRVAAQHRLLARIDMSRHIFGKIVGVAFREEGVAGVKKFVGPMLKLGARRFASTLTIGEDGATAERYQRLRHLPEGSFGRVYWEHCTSRGFGFPGEHGGIPERAVFHDFGHVLSGYDTDPGGEIQQAAFQAGFVRNDGFSFLFFGIAQFHLGLKLTPIAEPEVGYFDVEKVVTALSRGAACNTDLSDHWNFWPLLPLPLDEVRGLLEIPPLVPSVTLAA